MVIDKKTLASHELIRRGSMRHLLHAGQRKFYDMLKNGDAKEYFLWAARRWGKSYCLSILGIEHCLKTPNRKVRHIFPIFKTGKAAIFDIMGKIIPMLPEDMRPELKRSEATYIFPNGSVYIIGGASSETIDGNRGVDMTMLLADEAAFWDEKCFNELLYSILYPQMLHHPGSKVLFITTPPRSLNHPAVSDVLKRVSTKGNLLKATVYDNPLLSQATIEEQKELMGGEDSNAWKREMLCELLTDDNLRLTPEFVRDEHVIEVFPPKTDLYGNPETYVHYVSADLGLNDNTAIIKGYFDHNTATLVITDEWVDNYKTLTYIADVWKSMYPTGDGVHKVYETLDVWPLAAYELRHEHGLTFSNPRKGKIEETIAVVRNALENNKIKVYSKCSRLIHELTTATWDQKKKDVERNADGHSDCIMALAYMLKEVQWNYRPLLGRQSGLNFKKVSKHARR